MISFSVRLISEVLSCVPSIEIRAKRCAFAILRRRNG